MKTVLAPRASTILHDLLRSRRTARPFLLPANICPIVPITFLKAGTPFEFVDIAPATLHMDQRLIEKRFDEAPDHFGGLLYAHTYGEPSTPHDFFEWLKEHWPGILVIDDRCLCRPEFESGPRSAADATLYSTGNRKVVDVGFGGYAFLKPDVPCSHHVLPYDERQLAVLEAEYKCSIETGVPYVYRDTDWLETDDTVPSWDAYAALVGAALSEADLHRAAINEVYASLLPLDWQLDGEFHAWRFNLRVRNPDAVIQKIFAAGLFASRHYRSLVGIMGQGTDHNARELARHVVNLFNDHHFTMDMAERTARLIVGSVQQNAG